MKMIKMSYKGFVFPVNPSSIKIQFSKSISKRSIPFLTSKTQEICPKPTRITGEGIFTGNDAGELAHRLMRIFKSKGSAYLFLPDSEPVIAFFDFLSISYNADKSCVSYSFSFVEDCKSRGDCFKFGYTLAGGGENMFDIANRTNVSVERLFECNDYEDLFAVQEGDIVKLC